MVHTVGIVMPLSAKATSHCPSLTFIIQTISPHQGTDPPACRGLPCAAIQYPEQPLCSACFAHFSTSVSSPVETVLKAAFHSRNISHLTVFNINLFFFFFARVFIMLADVEVSSIMSVPWGSPTSHPISWHERGTAPPMCLRGSSAASNKGAGAWT